MKTHDKTPISLTRLIFIVCAIYLLSAVLILCLFRWPSNAGEFGDLFGAVNALFSGLAFACVTYAIFLQQRDLDIQSKALQLSQKEQSHQTELISKQLKAMQESFEFNRKNTLAHSEPIFRFRSSGGAANQKKIDIINVGADALDLQTHLLNTTEPKVSVKINPADSFQKNQKGHFIIVGFGGLPCPDVKFDLSYTNTLGDRRVKRFLIKAEWYKFEEIDES